MGLGHIPTVLPSGALPATLYRTACLVHPSHGISPAAFWLRLCNEDKSFSVATTLLVKQLAVGERLSSCPVSPAHAVHAAVLIVWTKALQSEVLCAGTVTRQLRQAVL